MSGKSSKQPDGTLKFNSTTDADEKSFSDSAAKVSQLPRLLMVHQLWLWKLDEEPMIHFLVDTVITAFPVRWHQGVEDCLLDTIRQGDIDSYQNPEQLVENIIFECVTFSEEFRFAGLGIHVLDVFESSIARRSNQEVGYFKAFRDSLKQQKRSLHKQVNDEISLIHEIKDIRDELHLILRIFETQRDVVKQFSGLDYLVQMKKVQSSLEEAESASRLNNYILLLTIFTIFFAPLSFMTSLFAIPFGHFPENDEGELRVRGDWVAYRMIAGEFSSLVAVGILAYCMSAAGWSLWRGFDRLLRQKGRELASSEDAVTTGHPSPHDREDVAVLTSRLGIMIKLKSDRQADLESLL
ncbi:hypothetical protein SAPIO_CDS6486 [Scedosporium apiospermum]|uniref:Uncharacterized protein n=1 Tax=Pseudallescheria apiosperma TaxID=563466 RepID=A0A084G3L7_PSEDA|nr:uncharacterized protein SAPIO_CDS6486 [Scedosporium apiospermum]KEZ41929.1 hypothetical protein SAPIO_CDS6486 [Scedosporium apiospermum]